jgi:ubiquinone/menaquinone biosynthesis C-methylase UbiE
MTNSFWKDHFSANVTKFAPNDFRRQVGKTVGGAPVGDDQIALIVEHIVSCLRLGPTVRAMDLGCGNGLITSHVAKHVAHVTGVDFTPGLLDLAIQFHKRENISYVLGDVLALHLPDGCDVVWAWELIQHLQKSDLTDFVRSLRRMIRSGGRAGIFGIPDELRREVFYDSVTKRRFAERMDRQGRPHIGTWFCASELVTWFEKEGFEAAVVEQPSDLYTAHYRFDLVVELQ